MRQKYLLIALLLLLTLALVALGFLKPSVGPHGGAVKAAGDYHIEMKAIYPYFYTYLLDGKMRPFSNEGVLCEVKFKFPDDSEIKASLKPYGEDGFFLESSSQNYYSCKIYFNVFGKYVSASFENQNSLLVNK
jgi:hypothetical protein